jgi:putative sigma-54 modulation protein
MNLNIKATNTTVTPGIRQNIEDKLEPLERFLRTEDLVHVEVEEDTRHHTGLVSRVEIRIQPHGCYADSRGSDFYEALDLVIPKVKEQLARQKDKKISLRRRVGNLFKRNR